jgi:hypothetical protein
VGATVQHYSAGSDGMNTERMLDRYSKKGGNRAEGAKLLNELSQKHDGNNLRTALVYWGFLAS